MSSPEVFRSVFARNCAVRRIDAALAREFLGSFHRYGWCRSRYCYGLFIGRAGGGRRDCSGAEDLPVGTLVAVSTFSQARRWLKDGRKVSSHEWVRYASLPDVRVQGGMGKMLDRFVEDVDPDDVMTYAPLARGDEGDVYRLLGFVQEGAKEFDGGISLKFRKKFRDY